MDYRVCFTVDNDAPFKSETFAGEPRPWFVMDARRAFEMKMVGTEPVFCVPVPTDHPSFKADLINMGNQDWENAMSFDAQ